MTAPLVPTPSGDFRIPPRRSDAGPRLRLSLVIPTYNESRNVGPLVQELSQLLDPVLGDAYEILVVDDDSPDHTWEIAAELADRNPRLRVLRRVGERGLSTAVLRGWQAARGDVLGVIDGDLQHPPSVALKLLDQIERGADLAVASRHVDGGGVSDWSAVRRALSRGAQLLGLVILPEVLGRLSDPMSGYFMVRREGVAGVALDPVGYKILIEVVARAKPTWIGEVGYVFRERIEGESKVTWKLYISYLRHLVRLRWATLLDSHLFKFCVVGGSGVLVDMGLLFLLSDPRMLGLGLTRSKIIGAQTAIVSNFLLNDFWTFRDRVGKNQGQAARLRRFLSFNAICLIGLVLNVILLNLFFNVAGLNRYVANVLAIVVVTGWNFAVNKRVNWTSAAKARTSLAPPPNPRGSADPALRVNSEPTAERASAPARRRAGAASDQE